MKRTFATDVWFSATMNEPDEIAINAATASPARPDGVERAQHRAALGDGDVREQAEHREERAAGDLRPDTDRQLALQEPGRRPGDRRERDEHASPPLLRAERQGRGRRRHRRIESALAGCDRSEQAVLLAAGTGREVERVVGPAAAPLPNASAQSPSI